MGTSFSLIWTHSIFPHFISTRVFHSLSPDYVIFHIIEIDIDRKRDKIQFFRPCTEKLSLNFDIFFSYGKGRQLFASFPRVQINCKKSQRTDNKIKKLSVIFQFLKYFLTCRRVHYRANILTSIEDNRILCSELFLDLWFDVDSIV